MSRTYFEVADILWEMSSFLRLDKQSNRRSTGFAQASLRMDEVKQDFFAMSRESMKEWSSVTEETLDALETLQQGKLPEGYEAYRKKFGTLPELIALQGIGAKTAVLIEKTLGVTNLEGLRGAIEDKTLVKVKGIGAKQMEYLSEQLAKHEVELAKRRKQIESLKTKLQTAKATQVKTADEPKKAAKKKPKKKKSQASDTPSKRPQEGAQKLDTMIDALRPSVTQTPPTPKAAPVDPPKATPIAASAGSPKHLSFEQMLRCPESKAGDFASNEHEIISEQTGTRYPKIDGVIDFLGDIGELGSPLQRLMETPLYTKFYEQLFRPQLTRFVTRRRLQDDIAMSVVELRARPDWAVLDVACGTGNYSRAIASQLDPQRGFLVGLDVSWPMLQRATKLRQRAGMQHVHFVRASAHTIPLADACMDATHCAGALHLLPNLNQALREFHRVTKPGGRLVLGAFLRTEWPFLKSLQKFSTPTIGFYWYKQQELQQKLERAGFQIEQENIQDLAITITAKRL